MRPSGIFMVNDMSAGIPLTALLHVIFRRYSTLRYHHRSLLAQLKAAELPLNLW